MKKLVFMCLFLAVTSPCFAVDLSQGVTTTATGDARGANGIATYHTVACWYSDTDNSITAATVDLEGSIDGIHFYQLATHPFTAGEITAKAAMFHVVNAPVSKTIILLIIALHTKN